MDGRPVQSATYTGGAAVLVNEAAALLCSTQSLLKPSRTRDVWSDKIQKRLASYNIIASLLVSIYISATLIQRRVCAGITISWKVWSRNGTVWKGCFYFIYLLQVDMYTLSKYIVKLKLCKTLQKCITLILTHQLNKLKSSQIDKEYNLTKNIPPPSCFTLYYVTHRPSMSIILKTDKSNTVKLFFIKNTMGISGQDINEMHLIVMNYIEENMVTI